MGQTNGHKLFSKWFWRGFGFRHDLIARDYMERWVFYTPIGCVRLHHILRSDSDRHHHDHPFDFTSVILRGGYIEYQPDKQMRRCIPGDLVRHRAEDLHYLKLLSDSAWTLVFAGNERRRWGFATSDGWIDADKYDRYLTKKAVAA